MSTRKSHGYVLTSGDATFGGTTVSASASGDLVERLQNWWIA